MNRKYGGRYNILSVCEKHVDKKAVYWWNLFNAVYVEKD
jgi:hypothetical protein